MAGPAACAGRERGGWRGSGPREPGSCEPATVKLREGTRPWTPVGVALPVGVGRWEREGPGRRPGGLEGVARLMDYCNDAQRDVSQR